MTLAAIVLGLLLGAIGGALYLTVTWYRASLVVRQRSPFLALALYPFALLGPGIAVFLAAKFAPMAAWITPIGFFVVRLIGLRMFGRADAPRPQETGEKAP